MKRIFRTALVLLLYGALGACHSGVKLDEGAAGATGGTGVRTNPNAVSQVSVDPLNDPNSPLAKRSIYFDFDDYSVKPEYESLLRVHAQYLKEHSQRHIRIEGNADERGSSEYNLALGQKRSEAVRRELILFGVPDRQMEAISFGKEKPVATGHDEASWAQNRRADLDYQH